METIPYCALLSILQKVKDSGEMLTLLQNLEASYTKDSASIVLDNWQMEMEVICVPARSQIMHHLKCLGLQIPHEAPLPWRYL